MGVGAGEHSDFGGRVCATLPAQVESTDSFGGPCYFTNLLVLVRVDSCKVECQPLLWVGICHLIASAVYVYHMS